MKTETRKKFSTEAVLAVYTGRLVCPIQGVYDVVSHLTGNDVYTHQIPRLMAPCKTAIAEQIPQLHRKDVTRIIDSLPIRLQKSTQDQINAEIAAWCADVRNMLGNSLTLTPMEDAVFWQTDPVESARDVAGDKVIACNLRED